MFHALIAAVLLQSPNLDYTTDATPLSKAVAALAKQAGKKLLVGDDLGSEPVILRLKQVPLQEAMDKIAEAFGAEWTVSDKGQTLTRTPAAVQRLLDERKRLRMASVQKGLASILAAKNKIPVLDAARADQIAREYVNMLKAEKQGQFVNGNAKRTELSNRTADARLLADVVAAIGPEALASQPAGSRLYAVDPTPMERPIPGITGERLEQYVAERNAIADALQRAQQGDLNDGLLFTGIQQASLGIQKTPVRLLVNVDAAPSEGIFVTLTVYDADGKQVADGQWNLGQMDPAEWFSQREKLMADAAKKPGIPISPELVALANRSKQTSKSAPAADISRAALQLLLQPEVHDPLDLGFSQLVLGMGEQGSLNVVATAGDWSGPVALQACAKGDLKPDYACELLDRWGHERFEQKDGWLVATPQDPLFATETRMDRPSFAAFMQETQREGYSPLEAWADLAVANPNPNSAPLATSYHNLWRANSTMYDYGFWAGYRLYGLLSESQRQALAQGQSIPCGAFSADQRECIASMVYDWGGLQLQGNGKTPEEITERNDFRNRIQSRSAESVPDGVPDNARITMSDDLQEKFYVSTEFQTPRSVMYQKDRPTDLSWLASELAQSQRPDLFAGNYKSTVKQVRYGHQRTLTFHGLVAPPLEVEIKLTEERRPQSEAIEVANLKDSLPQPVWERLNKQVQAYLDDYKRNEATIRKSRRAPQSTPPPPPAFLMG